MMIEVDSVIELLINGVKIYKWKSTLKQIHCYMSDVETQSCWSPYVTACSCCYYYGHLDRSKVINQIILEYSDFSTKELTHLPLVLDICISESG